MASEYNVGIIGYGFSAKVFQIPFVSTTPGLKLYAIVQRSPKPDSDAAKDFPEAIVYRSSTELAQDPKVDLVIVATTPGAHFEQAKEALLAGKHVLVEKPFTPTSAEADELIKLAKQQNRLLTVYQNRRWDNDFLTVRQLLDKKALGSVVEFETHFDRYDPKTPKSWAGEKAPGSGALFDLGTHLIDQVLVLLGRPEKVTGFLGWQRPDVVNGPEDSCTVLLHYPKTLASVKISPVSLETPQLRYWIRGTEGAYKKYHLDIQEPQLMSGMKPGDAGFGYEPESCYGTLTRPGDSDMHASVHTNVEPKTYGGLFSTLVTALNGQGPVPVAAEDARDTIRVIELAMESSAKGTTLQY